MTKDSSFWPELRDGIDVRYGPDLFYLYGAGRGRMFRYGLIRLCKNLIHWIMGFCTSFGKKKDMCGDVGLYTTRNQRIALEGLKKYSKPHLTVYSLYSIDTLLSFRMATIYLLAILLYPFCYWAARNHYSFHDTFLINLKVSALLKFLRREKLSSLTVSNDHQGEIYWGSFAWAYMGNNVDYVQHGMVKKEFPTNYFRTCYVRTQAMQEIYAQALCLRPGATAVIVPELADDKGSERSGVESYVLISLSHHFNYRETRLLAKHLRRELSRDVQIRMRFHPSDRFANIKFMLVCRGLENAIIDDVTRPFLSSFEHSKFTVTAGSSVLAEAVAIDSRRVIWVKTLGLGGDYYGVSQKVLYFETVEDFKNYPLIDC